MHCYPFIISYDIYTYQAQCINVGGTYVRARNKSGTD